MLAQQLIRMLDTTLLQADNNGTAASSGMPAYVPWLHGCAAEKLFVCDVMLEGLARQLRLFGLDAKCMATRGKSQRVPVIRCVRPCCFCLERTPCHHSIHAF